VYKFVQLGNKFYPQWDVTCGDCGSKMVLVTGDSIDRTLMYRCSRPECRCIHAAFPNGKPVGTPADQNTRSLRCVLHRILDPLWKDRHISRNRLYKRLAKRLGMSEEDCHVGKFNAKQCTKAIQVARRLSEDLQSQ